MPYFKYLGRVLSISDDDCLKVVHNISKARSNCEQLLHVLGREGADAQMPGMFYVEFVQVVLLYRSEIWVISPRIGKMLGGFHHQVECRLMGGHTKWSLDGMW